MQLDRLGTGRVLAQHILEKVGRVRFFEDLQAEDVQLLTALMQTYHAPADAIIIREGDVDDFMLWIIEGKVRVMKRDKYGNARQLGVVGSGMTLGEMSMIDGEPRFASCVAEEPTTLAVLTRDAMVRLLLEQPHLGSKLLIKLVTLLSRRLRETSDALLKCMEP